MPVAGRIAGDVLESGKPVYVPDVTNDPRWKPHPKANPAKAYKTLAVVPIKEGNETVAVLNVTSTEHDAFSETDTAYIELLAAVLEVAWGIDQAAG